MADTSGPPTAVTDTFDAKADWASARAREFLNVETASPEKTRAKELDTFRKTIPLGQKYAEIIFDTALTYGFPPVLIYGIGYKESLWGDAIGGPAGTGNNGTDLGLMQLNVKTYADLQKNYGFGADDWQDPEKNIRMGCLVLRQKYAFFRGNPTRARNVKREGRIYTIGGAHGLKDPRPLSGAPLTTAALAAYNAGEGNVLWALATQQAPDVVTADAQVTALAAAQGKSTTGRSSGYGASILKMVADVSRLLFARGSILGSAEPLAIVVSSPVAEGTLLKGEYRELYDKMRGAERSSVIAQTPRKDYYEERAILSVRQMVVAKNERGLIEQAAPTYRQPPPAFLTDPNYSATAYDFDRGMWGDLGQT